jgi:hypothetical protein
MIKNRAITFVKYDMLFVVFADHFRSSRDVNAAVKRQLIYPAQNDRWELMRGVNGATQLMRAPYLTLAELPHCQP